MITRVRVFRLCDALFNLRLKQSSKDKFIVEVEKYTEMEGKFKQLPKFVIYPAIVIAEPAIVIAVLAFHSTTIKICRRFATIACSRNIATIAVCV